MCFHSYLNNTQFMCVLFSKKCNNYFQRLTSVYNIGMKRNTTKIIKLIIVIFIIAVSARVWWYYSRHSPYCSKGDIYYNRNDIISFFVTKLSIAIALCH